MTKTDLEPILPTTVPAVLNVLKESSRADEYLMRLVLRFCVVAQDGLAPHVETLLSPLTEIFVPVDANPANPLFNHYLFEAISAPIRFNCNENTVVLFEGALFGPMCDILKADVTEFAPYVFQVMSQLMMINRGTLPVTYAEVMGPILNPVMWERKGYIPGMVQFIESFITKSKGTVVAHVRQTKLNLLMWDSAALYSRRLYSRGFDADAEIATYAGLAAASFEAEAGADAEQ